VEHAVTDLPALNRDLARIEQRLELVIADVSPPANPTDRYTDAFERLYRAVVRARLDLNSAHS
jgi:hypothetical protein